MLDKTVIMTSVLVGFLGMWAILAVNAEAGDDEDNMINFTIRNIESVESEAQTLIDQLDVEPAAKELATKQLHNKVLKLKKNVRYAVYHPKWVIS